MSLQHASHVEWHLLLLTAIFSSTCFRVLFFYLPSEPVKSQKNCRKNVREMAIEGETCQRVKRVPQFKRSSSNPERITGGGDAAEEWGKCRAGRGGDNGSFVYAFKLCLFTQPMQCWWVLWVHTSNLSRGDKCPTFPLRGSVWTYQHVVVVFRNSISLCMTDIKSKTPLVIDPRGPADKTLVKWI